MIKDHTFPVVVFSYKKVVLMKSLEVATSTQDASRIFLTPILPETKEYKILYQTR